PPRSPTASGRARRSCRPAGRRACARSSRRAGSSRASPTGAPTRARAPAAPRSRVCGSRASGAGPPLSPTARTRRASRRPRCRRRRARRSPAPSANRRRRRTRSRACRTRRSRASERRVLMTDVLTPVLSDTWDAERSWTLETYLAHGGYEGLRAALAQDPADLVQAVKDSGLRGRGGAGFPTGMKWGFLPAPDGGPRYLVVNADESEPGTCKDIPLMLASPQHLIEGVA